MNKARRTSVQVGASHPHANSEIGQVMSKKSLQSSRRTFVAGSAAAVSTFFIHGVAKAEDPTIVKLATAAPRGTPWYRQLRDVKKNFNDNNGGKYKLKTYVGSALGDELSTLDKLKRGQIHIWAGTSGAIASKIPEMGAFELPFLFPGLKAADYVIDKLYDDIDSVLGGAGFKLLFASENGHRSIGMAGSEGSADPGHAEHEKFIIRSPKQLKGIPVRSQPSFVHRKTWQAMGASPQEIAVTETLGALKSGIVKGFDNTPLFCQAASWHSGITHWTNTKHIYQPGFVLMSKDLWDEMGPSIQQLMFPKGDPLKEAERGRRGVRALRSALLQNFTDMGIHVHKSSKDERKTFKSATAKVHDQFKSKYGGDLLGKIKANL